MLGRLNALKGVRVLDISRVLAGPLVGQMLGDLGAEVIKVEHPRTGDESRQYGPPFVGDADDPASRATSFFLSANRNKKSVTIDFSTPQGQALVVELAKRADVLIENFRVDTLSKYGLDYASLSAENPGLVYCSITGYGQTGPYRKRPGYDAVFQAMGGLMSSIGYPDDHPAAGPLRSGVSITDVITGLYASIGVVAAIHGREANAGQGVHIDMSLMDSTVAAMSHYAVHYLMTGDVLPRRGNGGNGGVPSQAFQCADGAIMLTAGNDAQFKRLCEALGIPSLATDTRFASGPARIENRQALMPMLEQIFREKSRHHWLDALVAAEIPAGPINDLAGVFRDPQILARAMSVPLRSGESEVNVVGNPIAFIGAPTSPNLPAPTLGQHTEEVLIDVLGLSPDSIAEFRRSGVI